MPAAHSGPELAPLFGSGVTLMEQGAIISRIYELFINLVIKRIWQDLQDYWRRLFASLSPNRSVMPH
jgi:hypothetical protein